MGKRKEQDRKMQRNKAVFNSHRKRKQYDSASNSSTINDHKHVSSKVYPAFTSLVTKVNFPSTKSTSTKLQLFNSTSIKPFLTTRCTQAAIYCKQALKIGKERGM